MEAENRDAVRIGVVVGDRERFDLLGLAANVMPRDPLSGAAKGLPVAEMKPWLQRPEIRLAARLEAAPCGAAIQIGVPNGASH